MGAAPHGKLSPLEAEAIGLFIQLGCPVNETPVLRGGLWLALCFAPPVAG